jgi:hypothetical protein
LTNIRSASISTDLRPQPKLAELALDLVPVLLESPFAVLPAREILPEFELVPRLCRLFRLSFLSLALDLDRLLRSDLAQMIAPIC